MTDDRSAWVTGEEVRQRLRDLGEIALLDVRTERAHATGHPLFAANLPRHRIEVEVHERVPRRDCLVVVVDADGGELGLAAALVLQQLGYSEIRRLCGGILGWVESGGELFTDVNSASKAFGELVDTTCETPAIGAGELEQLLRDRANVVVVDARPFGEYATMSIPSAINVPGAELVLHAPAIAADADTTIVVNCAGRTRSIIGAQSLVNAEVPHQVFALRNGTIGWQLAGLTLETGQRRTVQPVSEHDVAGASARARKLAIRAGAREISMSSSDSWLADPARTTYLFDVRSPDDYLAGHLPGSRSAPGGQLVQETDVYAPVRGARIIVYDVEAVRAPMTASWLAQMGWEVGYLQIEQSGLTAVGESRTPSLPEVEEGHYVRPYVGTDVPAEAMQAYLDWEHGLVDQLRRDGTHNFRVLTR